MKKSRFNLLVDINDRQALIFNSFSRGFLELDRAHYDRFDKLDLSPEEELYKQLKRGFFIHDDDVDELRVYEARSLVSRYASSSFGLTIVPTLDCNFACEYCFETHNKEYMSEETADQVVEFARGFLQGVRRFHLSWFGGEPLMARKIMDRVSRGLIQVCDEMGIAFSSDVVTNGYLLTEKNIEWLRELRVNQVQVTFDGDKETHDSRRRLKDGRPTFDVLIANLKKAAGKFKLNVRINIDKNNVDKVRNIYPVIEESGLSNDVFVYFGTIFTATEACKDYEASCLDVDALGKILLDYHGEALEKNREYLTFPFPLAILGGCGAMKPTQFIIDAHGGLHKCLNTVGTDEDKLGHISQPVEMTPDLSWWLTWNPLNEPDCRECRALPLCGGGCPYLRRKGDHTCTYFKTAEYMSKLLKLYYEGVYLKGRVGART